VRRFLALALLFVPHGLVPLASGDEKSEKIAQWTHWRGPSGQGYADDDRVPLEWGEDKNVLWKTKLPGQGHSSPIIWGDRIFLTGSSDGGSERSVFCVRRSDGKVLWKQTAAKDLGRERTHAWNGHASASCATDGKYVYAFFGTPGLFCYDIDGKFVWKKEFGSFASMGGWGTGASPVLYGDTVIMNCDNDGGVKGAAPAALVALDKTSGAPKWSTPRDQGRGFSTPRLMKMADGRTDLVLNGAQALCGYDPKTGKERWRVARSAPRDQHQFGEPVPVDDGERIFVLSGRTGPYQVIDMPGSGDLTKKNVVHTATRGKRDVASPILHAGKVYCVDSRVSGLTVFDLKTGKESATLSLGKGRANSMASPIRVRGKLLWVLDEGTTVVIEPGDRPKLVAKNKLDGSALDYGASPAVVDGKIYIRSRTHLYCIGEKK
jgi:outer membrane protein assembly factor BamB